MATPVAAFGLQLYVQLMKLGGAAAQAGYFISPLSAYIALVLALNGAGPMSQTHKELWVLLTQKQLPNTLPAATSAESAFNSQTSNLIKGLIGQSSGNGTELLIANALWTNQTTVLPQYASNMLKLYQAPVTAVTSAAPINAWADKSTKGLIKQAIPADAKFNAVITNAVYFKGSWAYPFKKSSTSKMLFTTLSNNTVQVDMMSKGFSEQGVEYAEVPGAFRALKLPYAGSRIVAIAVLPDRAKYGLNADAGLTGIGLDKIFAAPWESAATAEPQLQVYLPRFKVKLDMLPVGTALKALNVAAMFSPKDADFSRLSQEDLYITDVVQSVAVIVDESGTEAAAVTAILARATAFMPDPTPPLVFDRPFIFMLVDNSTNDVLFMGTVKDPSKSST